MLMLVASFFSLFSGVVTDEDPKFFNSTLNRNRRQNSMPLVPPSLDELTITAQMIEFCNNITACLYDLAVTGNMDVAEQTRDFTENTTAHEEQLSMNI